MRGYTRMIRVTTRWRYTTLLAAIAFLIGSVYFLFQVPGSFLPPDDASRIVLSVELPPNARLDDTDKATDAVYQRVKNINGVESVFVLGGASPKGDLELRRATVTLGLYKRDQSLVTKLVNDVLGSIPIIGPHLPKVTPKGRIRPQWDIEKEVFAKLNDIPDVRITKLNDRGDRDLSFNFLSRNATDLNNAIAILESKLRADPLLANVSPDGALPRPELQIHPRKDEAARLGITPQAISDTLRVATIGDSDALLAKISLDDRQIPIRVQASLDMRRDLAAIRALRIQTASGGTVPLSTVADIDYSEGLSSIKRNNRYRVVAIGADLPQGVALNSASDRFRQIVTDAKIPASVHLAESGDAKVQGEMQQGFINAMLLGLLLVLSVLILLFKDVIQPFTILFSLPLAIGGVAAALIITHNPLSMPVLIGILMLMGIVTKNAILLVDFAIEMMHKGMPRVEAMVEAGRKRARPIIMTSIAMSAGMLPSALGVGEGGSFRAPMAIAVIGGIIVSTVLSLIVVPSFFLIMNDLSRLLGWLFGRLVGRRDADDVVVTQESLAASMAANRAELSDLERRFDRLERKDQTHRTGDDNILNLPHHAAE